jgi:electron transport complex protein RnfG
MDADPKTHDDGAPPVAPPVSSIRLVLALSLTGLLSGLVLVGVYLATEPRIRKNRAEALRAAIFRVLPGATEISTFVLEGDALTAWEGGGDNLPTLPAVYAGSDDGGRLVGYAIPADGPGFMDTVGLIYGLDLERRVIVGMQVLESRETPGLGDRIAFDPQFMANFVALAVDPKIEPVKRGKKVSDNQVDCITGATISSEAVVSILNRSAQRWLPLLEQLQTREVADGS